MKSARELAMEKTAKWVSKEGAGLSEEQKKRISEIEAEFRAKVAEAEIMQEQKIQKALSGDPLAVESAVQALGEEFRKDREKWEEKKNREIETVRAQKA